MSSKLSVFLHGSYLSKNKNDFSYKENSILLITDINDKTQIIKVKGEGGQGTYVEPNDKFSFVDVNFDGKSNLLVKTGSFGSQETAQILLFFANKKRVQGSSFIC